MQIACENRPRYAGISATELKIVLRAFRAFRQSYNSTVRGAVDASQQERFGQLKNAVSSKTLVYQMQVLFAGGIAFAYVAQAPANSAQSQQEDQHTYPPYDASFPGLCCVHSKPDIFIVKNMLESSHCRALINDAADGRLMPICYDNSVLLNYDRLRPLGLVILAGAGTPALFCIDIVRPWLNHLLAMLSMQP